MQFYKRGKIFVLSSRSFGQPGIFLLIFLDRIFREIIQHSPCQGKSYPCSNRTLFPSQETKNPFFEHYKKSLVRIGPFQYQKGFGKKKPGIP